MKVTLSKIDWDSAFFNFRVGRIEGAINTEKDLRNIESLMEENNIELSYYSTLNQLSSCLSESNKLDIHLVDKKVTYTKSINSELITHKSIAVIDQKTPHKNKLIHLAIQSGVYSRFNIDKRIGKEKFKELYGIWIKKSLDRKISKEVLGFKENNELAGFVTLGEKNKRGDIGLIAVDYDFRGKGIGKTLMKSAEKWFSNLGYSLIQVVTQKDNIPACRLYESCGYDIESTEFFYHFWKKKD